MGKFVKGVAVTLGIVILFLFTALIGSAVYDTYQDHFGGKQECVEQLDSTQVCECQGSILDKEYVCADDVISDHQQLMLEVKYIDGFRDVPEETIKNVVNMLLRARPSITIADIVNEYLANKNIYDNIQPNAVTDPGANSDSINKTITETKSQESTNMQDPNPVAVQEQMKALSSATTTSTNAKPTR